MQGCCALLVLAAAVPISPTITEELSVGRQVVVIADARLQVGDMFPGLAPKVASVDGDWLRIGHVGPARLAKEFVVPPLELPSVGTLPKRFARIPTNASAYNLRGAIWIAQGDLDRAIADFGAAIRLDPNYAMAYSNRGSVWKAKKDFDKALADYDAAIRLDPEYANAYNNRGNVWDDKGDLDKALADFDQAILLDPKTAGYYKNRASAWLDKGAYDKALADLDQAIVRDAKHGSALFLRGVIRLSRRDAGAVEDFRRRIEIEGWWSDRAIYAVVLGSLAARLNGDAETAKALLDDGARELDETKWPYPAVRFLRGELDSPAFLALATDGDRRTEVECFLGLDRLIAGDVAGARVRFEWVVEYGSKNYIEYDIAVAELKRLDAASR